MFSGLVVSAVMPASRARRWPSSKASAVSAMMGSVAAHYAVKEGPQGIGLVRHGTYSKKSPYNTCTPEGVDECVSWGDYFYMEALTRLTKDWELYW